MLEAMRTRTEVDAVRATRRASATFLTLLAVLAMVAGCSAAVGPLGTPSSPAPTGNASVVPPSGDATPNLASVLASLQAQASALASAAAAPSSSPAPTVAPTLAPSLSPAPSGTTIVRAYFVLGSFTGNPGLVPVLREIPATSGVATAAMRQLIAGPSADELGARPAMYTAIPANTKLLGLSINSGVATVSLSREFASGFGSPTDSFQVAQVVYTLTQFSTVKQVVLNLEGNATPIMLGTRANNRNGILPGIFVDRPAWGAAAGNPVKVSGVSNVFEATFRVQVKDASGHVLAEQQVPASCGTGCWGDFSTTVAYTVSSAQWGTLRVYDFSAKDGTTQDVTEYPVWLTPAG